MNKNITCVTIFLIFISAALTGCSSNGEKDRHLYLYRRDSGSNNSYESHADKVYIKNYTKKSISIDSFAKMAIRYVDTVKSHLPVSSVIFMGRPFGKDLPNSNPDNYSDQVLYYLVRIGLNNGIAKLENDSLLGVRSLTIWKNGEIISGTGWDRLMPPGDIKIDSAMNSKLPFDINF